MNYTEAYNQGYDTYPESGKPEFLDKALSDAFELGWIAAQTDKELLDADMMHDY